MDEAIVTEGLTKFYGATPGVEELNLRVPRGEVFALLGPNGAGKTTTMRLLMDFIRPSRGEAWVLGREVRQESMEVRRRVGYLPGELYLYPDLTGRELLAFLAALRELSDERGIKALVERLEVDTSRPIGELSTGTRQKLGIVQAWMHAPEILILDEPTIGLDPLVQHVVHEMMLEAKASGRTVFLSSHLLSQVERVADRVGIVRDGHLVAVEGIAALKSRALRRLEIEFAGKAPLEILAQLEGVRVVESSEAATILEMEGSVGPVLTALAGHEVTNLVTHEPDLEEIFMGFYK